MPPAARLSLALVVTLAYLAAGPHAAEAAGPPQVGPSWTTEVTASSATLHAEVNPEGSLTTYRFQYVGEAAYVANIAAGREPFAGAATAPTAAGVSLGSATVDQPAQQHVQGLAPSTGYRYRVVATSECEAGRSCIVEGSPASFVTEETAPVFSLPDSRGWELVSPVDKNGGAIQGPGQIDGGGTFQASAGGGAITYSSSASFGEGAQGAAAASQYISRRAGDGWSTANITAPALSGSYGEHPDGVPYQLFSTDLTAGLMLDGEHCRVEGQVCPVANPPLPGSDAPPGYQDYYLHDDESGTFEALLTGTDADLRLGAARFDLALAGATPDLHHVVLSTCAALTPEAFEVREGEGCDAADPNLYEWTAGSLSLLTPDPGEALPGHFGRLAASAGAVSDDGGRVYITDASTGDLLLSESGAGERAVSSGPASFQAASTDGRLAYFTSGAAGDEALYRYDAATQTTTGPLAEEVLGVLGASDDGSTVYYATSVGLFRLHEGAVTEIAPGADAAAPSDFPPATGTSRTSAGGAELLFLSAAPLAGDDDTDAGTGEPDTEVYLYSAGTGALTCVSCNPTGERPHGPSTIPGALADGDGPGVADSYKPRDLTASGDRVFFDSADSLVLQDTDSAPDVYEWEAGGVGSCRRSAGCVGLISGGRSPGGASFLDASESGADAFFLTDASLVPQDPGSSDLYDAREGGGFPAPPTAIECDGDACQSLPPEPADPTPGTLVPGQGNPARTTTKPAHGRNKNQHRRKKRRHRRHGRPKHQKKRPAGGHP